MKRDSWTECPCCGSTDTTYDSLERADEYVDETRACQNCPVTFVNRFTVSQCRVTDPPEFCDDGAADFTPASGLDDADELPADIDPDELDLDLDMDDFDQFVTAPTAPSLDGATGGGDDGT